MSTIPATPDHSGEPTDVEQADIARLGNAPTENVIACLRDLVKYAPTAHHWGIHVAIHRLAPSGESSNYVRREDDPPNPPTTLTVSSDGEVSGFTGIVRYCAKCETHYEPANPLTPTCKCEESSPPGSSPEKPTGLCGARHRTSWVPPCEDVAGHGGDHVSHGYSWPPAPADVERRCLLCEGPVDDRMWTWYDRPICRQCWDTPRPDTPLLLDRIASLHQQLEELYADRELDAQVIAALTERAEKAHQQLEDSRRCARYESDVAGQAIQEMNVQRERAETAEKERDEAQSLWNHELERRAREAERGRYFTHEEAIATFEGQLHVLEKSLLDERERRVAAESLLAEKQEDRKEQDDIQLHWAEKWKAEVIRRTTAESDRLTLAIALDALRVEARSGLDDDAFDRVYDVTDRALREDHASRSSGEERHAAPCTYCGQPTTDGFREYGGGFTYRCARCPQPRRVPPHTPASSGAPDPWREAMAEGIECSCTPDHVCAGHRWGILAHSGVSASCDACQAMHRDGCAVDAIAEAHHGHRSSPERPNT